MLTPRENFIECITGGNPDRFVKQYEAFALMPASPFVDKSPMPTKGYLIDAWGCYQAKLPGQPGLFPMHDMEHRVIKDITDWKNQVKAPGDPDDPDFWAPWVEAAKAVDRKEQFVCSMVIPGVFERCHHLMEITEALINLYDEPEAMHELIDEIVDWELRLAKAEIKYLNPDALFHHDDWGTQISTFMDLDTFEEFFLEPYKTIYGFYKDNGVEVVVHHSDSFGETLVPYMIEMGIDVWQGPLRKTNNIQKLVDTYGGQISFMGGIESAVIDKPGWTKEEVAEEVWTAISSVDRKNYYIPCVTSGMNASDIPGVYDAINEEIDKASLKYFG